MINWNKYSYKVEGKKTSRRKKKYVNPSYNVEDVYRHFKQTHKDPKLLEIKQLLFKKINYAFNLVLTDYMIKGHLVKLPFGLGEIGVIKRKLKFDEQGQKSLAVNYGKIWPENKPLKYINEFSNYWQALVKWNKRNCRIENKTFYSFKPNPLLKKGISEVMSTKGGYLNYYEMKPYYPKPKPDDLSINLNKNSNS